MESSLDPASLAIVEAMRARGYTIEFKQVDEMFHITSTHLTGQTRGLTGNDLYQGIRDLSEHIGIKSTNGSVGAT